MELIQISITGTAGLGAGYLLRQFLQRTEGSGPTLQGTVAALQSIVARLEIAISTITTIQGDVTILQQAHRQTVQDIARIDHDITDVRREAAEMDARLRRVERRG